MNLLLLLPEDYTGANQARITGRRAEHIRRILTSQVGDTISVGELNGNTGTAKITAIDADIVVLEVPSLLHPPPATLPLQLILGLPRPRMLQRLLQAVTTMGVETLHLLQTSRVEKSFWQTPLLQPEAVRAQLLLGLEQGKATQLPDIQVHKRFTPFIEDVLPILAPNSRKCIAHPTPSGQGWRCLAADTAGASPQPTLLAIGPEGGFIAPEVESFVSAGFKPMQLGPRILKVETAVPVAIAKLF